MEVSKDNLVHKELCIAGYVLGNGIRKKVVKEAFNVRCFNSAYLFVYKYVLIF